MSNLKKTVLNELHIKLGATMAPFAGYSMPIQYKGQGILKESLKCRNSAVIFDVSHMGQVRFIN